MSTDVGITIDSEEIGYSTYTGADNPPFVFQALSELEVELARVIDEEGQPGNLRTSILGLPLDDNYFDILDWLAEQSIVEVRIKKFALYAGSLNSEARGRGDKHLESDTKIMLPLSTAMLLTRKDLVEPVMPAYYSETVQRNLRENACIVNLRNLNPYYFEVGMKLANIVKDDSLAECLIQTAKDRMILLMQASLKTCDQEERSALSQSKTTNRSTCVELDVFLSGVTFTEQYISDLFQERLIPSTTKSILSVYSSSSGDSHMP